MLEIDLGWTLSLLGVFSAAGGGIAAVVHLLRRLETVEQVSSRCREDVKVIYKGVFACLDGLRQLGANGNVTKAYEKMRDHAVDE